MRESLKIINELAQSPDPKAKELAGACNRVLPILAALGDADAQNLIQAKMKSVDKTVALDGRANQLMADWIRTGREPAARQALLATARGLLRDNPANESLAGTIFDMGNELNADGQGAHSEILEMVAATKTRTGQQAKRLLAEDSVLKPLEGKPLALEGECVDGKHLSTAEWKGKVILVDFWATWCGPCRQELPRVQKVYAKYHVKGLEVLGISSDRDAATLQKFLAENKQMPWPELFDPHSDGWHPLARKLGIESIPTMFLIDKHGILRSVDARRNFEELIPKLLEE